MLLCWPIANAIFCTVKVKNIGQIIYIGDLFKIPLEFSPKLFEKTVKSSRSTTNSVLIVPPMEFCKRQSKLENRQKCSILFFHFFSVFEYALPFTEFYRRNYENRIGGTTKIKENLSSAFEKADSQWKYIFESWHSRTKTIFEDREKIPQKTRI